MRNYAFTTIEIKRLIAIIEPTNTASIRVAEKVGIRYEQDIMLEGYSHTDHVYAISNT